ncbi:MAG: ATP phosphoribosyltransferase regulatory subunit [Eubacterium sp.]|nr:ATP phosphoribosyltransferase regulatory subunit [Eubacterium sp.]
MNNKQSFEHSLLFTPQGVRDVYGRECREQNVIRGIIEQEMRLYGFRDIHTPGFEFFDIFNKERGTVPSNEMFKFFDQYNNTIVLRPDHTPQIARCVARYYENEDMQLRLCYTGSTFRNQRGYQGKLSETTQIGAEIIGDASSDADGEMLTLMIECFKKCGLNEFQIDVGHAGVFHGLVREAGLNEDEIARLRLFIQNKNSHAVEEMLKDREIPGGVREVLVRMPEIFADENSLQFVRERVNDEGTLRAIERLDTLHDILEGFNMLDHVTLDLGLLGQMDYYTGVIFKAYTYGTGEAIASGGRYDSLMSQFGKDAPAVGVVFMLDQLMEGLRSEKVDISTPDEDVLVLYRSANRTRAIELATELRDNGTPVFLMRKNADVSLEEYKAYAARRSLAEIRYIDDTGEITIFEVDYRS